MGSDVILGTRFGQQAFAQVFVGPWLRRHNFCTDEWWTSPLDVQHLGRVVVSVYIRQSG